MIPRVSTLKLCFKLSASPTGMPKHDAKAFRIITLGHLVEHVYVASNSPVSVDPHGVLYTPVRVMHHPYCVYTHRATPVEFWVAIQLNV
jgi:hypothetical protein